MGKEWVVAYLTMWLIELNDNSNVKNRMSEAQMEFTADRIYESYSLKITDLTLFFRNIKEGVYGSFYENLSQEKIMGWLKEYFDLRCEYGQMQAQSKQGNYSMAKDPLPPEVIKEMFKGVGEEKIVFEHDKRGAGIRTKQLLELKILNSSIETLKDYLLKNDSSSQFYDADMYESVEKEIDKRNSKTK